MTADPVLNGAETALTVDIDVDEGAWAQAIADLRGRTETAVAAALTAARRTVSLPDELEVSVLLTADARQRSLNKDFRGKDAPTNVLSFPAFEDGAPKFPAGQALAIGDISLAYETMTREAEMQGLPIDAHFTHLLVHGTLHLLGFDHENAQEAERMEGLETEILAGLGIADPYADSVADGMEE